MSQEKITYDIPSFCDEHNISRSFFYKLLKEQRGPHIMRVGRRTIITAEAARAWRHKMEAGHDED